MPDLIELGRGKLEDPLVMSWALQRYSLARYRLQDRRRMEEAWFGESIMRHWVESGDKKLLREMLDALPDERFSGLEPAIAERWRSWKGRLLECATSCLRRNSPATLIPLFDEEIARDPVDSERLEILASSLESLPMPSRLELLQSLANRIPDIENEESGRRVLHQLLRPALNLGPDVLSKVLEAASLPRRRADEGDRDIMAKFCEALLGDACLFFDAMSMTAGEEAGEAAEEAAEEEAEEEAGEAAEGEAEGEAEEAVAAFSERRPFFEAEAPLEECDRALKAAISPAEALELLEGHRPGSQVADNVRRFLPVLLSKHGATERGAACLAVAATLDTYELREIETGSLGLMETLRLLTLAVYRNRHLDALTDRLRDFDPGEVAADARVVMDLLRFGPDGSRLVRAIGVLELVELVPDLIEWANERSHHSVIEAAELVLDSFGEPAARAVMERWDGFDFTQKIMGQQVLEHVGGQAVSEFALERHEDMFGDRDSREGWWAIVAAAPDGRAVDLLARHVHRKQPDIDRSYCTLCVLTGREPENLPEVRQRVLERRRSATWTREESSGHVELELACGECGEINTYLVRDVVLSIVEEPGPRNFVREEFPCASCGEFPDFKLTVNAVIALTASVLRYRIGLSHGSPVSRLDVNYRGEKRSVAGVIEELGAALKSDPRSMVNLLRMGRVQRLLGRPVRALRLYAKAMEIAPASMEAGLGVAQIAAGRGEARKALDLLSRLQENEANWRFFRADEVSPGALKRDFSSLRRRLQAALGEPSVVEDSGGNRRRTGRNELCPCGSGKKYKKCCLRAGR